MSDFNQLLWREEQLPEGLSQLGFALGADSTGIQTQNRWQLQTEPNQWFAEQCTQINLESQRVAMPLGDLTSNTPAMGSCIIKLDREDFIGYLVVLRTSKRSLQVLCPNGDKSNISNDVLLDAVIAALKLKSSGAVENILSRFEQSAEGLSESLARKLFISLMSSVEINGIWAITVKDKPNIIEQLRSQGLSKYLTAFVFGLLAIQLFFISSWFVLGSNVLAGRPGSDWLSIWLILLGGFVVSRFYTRQKQAQLSLMISAQIKRRMLQGMTNMPLQSAKSIGPCNLLTRCYESGQFESASVSLVLSSLSTIVTLLVAFSTLILLELWGLMLACLLIGIVMALVMWRLYLIEVQWTAGRLKLTHSLAELMIGQRTRRVQQLPQLRHLDEDGKLKHYIGLQQKRDSLQVIYGLIPSAWNVLGIGVLLLGFATGSNMVNLPAGAGIWLMISTAIAQLSSIYLQVIRLLVAWKTIAPLLEHKDEEQKTQQDLIIPDVEHTDRLLELRDLAYNYPDRDATVLEGCHLQLGSNDKIILEGRSGSGKSTLISLLTGIRSATRGSILLHGIEQNMVSRQHWRQKVVMVPQYHENFLFTETLAFNLLLGTQWPAEPEQLEKARQICHELGLSELLEKMPAELMQVVGEMGWALSHGEKSRVYIARAILQQPDLLILDESLASLDPVNSNRVLSCVEKHCKAVLIVAHP